MTEKPPARSGRGGRAPESYVWPLVALVLVILPQVLVPADMREGPPVVVPIIEGAVVLVLVAANTAAAARLVVLVLQSTPPGQPPPTVTQLLVGAGIVIATNIVTFGLLYWQIDGGGPAGRVVRARPYPDFQFPQTQTEGLGPPGWQPRYPDYLYVAFTNFLASTPTETNPLTHRVKAAMAIQSLVSLSVIGLV